MVNTLWSPCGSFFDNLVGGFERDSALHGFVRLLDVRGHLSLDISGEMGISVPDSLPTYAGTNPCDFEIGRVRQGDWSITCQVLRCLQVLGRD